MGEITTLVHTSAAEEAAKTLVESLVPVLRELSFTLKDIRNVLEVIAANGRK